VKNLTQQQATAISGQDPDYTTKDLYEEIEKGNFPSWTVYAQIIDPLEAEIYQTNIFDATRTVSQKDYPLIPFGKITLNQNVVNYFSEVEQSAFNPTHIVPGWSISPDPILQIRLFAYGDTQRYRLGVNNDQLPINRPFYSYNPTKRDGANNIMNYGSLPNYLPSDFAPPIVKAAQYEQRADHEEWIGTVVDFETVTTDADFVQPREFWEVLGRQEGQQKNFVYNVAVDLSMAIKEVRYQTYDTFSRIDKHLAEWLEKETEAIVKAGADDEEITGIVVGGDVTGKAQISGSPMADGEEDAAVKDVMQNLDSATLSNGSNSKASNDRDFHKKLNAVKDHVERGHLFNLVAKGFNKEA
jgi:catalase